MQGHLVRVVAKGFEDGDLVALHADQPLENHIEQKRGHTQKDGGEQARHGAQLLQLVVQGAVRRLVDAANGTEPAIARQGGIQRVDHATLVGVCRQLERDLVEGAIHIHGGLQRLMRHPHDDEALVIGQARTGVDLIQKFWRGGNAHDGEPLRPPIDGEIQLVAGGEAVCVGKGVTDQNFARRIGQQHAAGAQVQSVLLRLPAIGQRQHRGHHRFVKARHFDLGAGSDARFHFAHTGNFAQAIGYAVGRTLEARPHVGEAVLLIQPGRGAAQ